MSRSYGHPTLNQMFRTLAEAGGADLSKMQRTIFCDGNNTLFLHKPDADRKLQPYGNLPLYRLLLAFNDAGAKIVVLSDKALDLRNPDLRAFAAEIEAKGLDNRLLLNKEGQIRVASWDSLQRKCGVVIDNNEASHHKRAHVYMHPADSELQELQDAARKRGFKMSIPRFMKLEA